MTRARRAAAAIYTVSSTPADTPLPPDTLGSGFDVT